MFVGGKAAGSWVEQGAVLTERDWEIGTERLGSTEEREICPTAPVRSGDYRGDGAGKAASAQLSMPEWTLV